MTKMCDCQIVFVSWYNLDLCICQIYALYQPKSGSELLCLLKLPFVSEIDDEATKIVFKAKNRI